MQTCKMKWGISVVLLTESQVLLIFKKFFLHKPKRQRCKFQKRDLSCRTKTALVNSYDSAWFRLYVSDARAFELLKKEGERNVIAMATKNLDGVSTYCEIYVKSAWSEREKNNLITRYDKTFCVWKWCVAEHKTNVFVHLWPLNESC